MKWKTNARYNQDATDGSIFACGIVTIHRIHGVPGTWFLSCEELGISKKNLNTDDFDEAILDAKVIISMKFNKLKNIVESFVSDDSKTTYYRY